MYYYFQISLISTTLLLRSAVALPRSAPPTGQTKIHRVSTESKALRSGTLAVHKAYRKYGWDMPQGLSDAAVDLSRVAVSNDAGATASTNTGTAGSTGSGTATVHATPVNYDAEWLCPVTVGGQTLNLNFDTGSSDLWVYNPSLGSDVTSGHAVYNPSESKSYKAVGNTAFSLEYGDQSTTTGSVASDTVTVGDITVQNMDVELPTTVSSSISSDTKSDGILGLGFQSLNSICKKSASAVGSANGCPQGFKPQPGPTWFENAKDSLKAGVFTANLKKGTAGSFEFGTIDQAAYKGPLTYTPIDNSKGYWSFPSQTSQVGSAPPLKRDDSNFGIMDSGTSVLMLDPAVVSAYYASVPKSQHDGQGNFIFPCGTTLPDFKVDIGNYQASISGDMLNYAPSSNGTNMCFGGIQSNSGTPPQVFGDILFQAEFLVFDYDNLQLGLAPHA